MSFNTETVIVFAKRPRPGEVKTRLSPPLDPQQAANLSACFVADMLEVVRALDGVHRVLACDPPQARGDFQELAPDFEVQAQEGAELGERMQRSLERSFAGGSRRAVLIGSDLPHLPPERLKQAFERLRGGADAVLGPSADGGYYLIGLAKPETGFALPEALFDVPMSTPQVLRQTAAAAGRLGLRLALLAEEFDVDTPADLEKLRAHLRDHPAVPAACTRAWLSRYAAGSSRSKSRSMRR